MHLKIPAGDFAAYIFDCDGTIADSMPVHLKAWQAELARYGCPFTEREHNELAGTPTPKIIEILNERRGLAMDPARVAADKERRYFELISTVEPVHAVVEVIRERHGKIPLAVASGSYRESVLKTLETLRLTECFDAIVAAEDYARGKPAPDPFLLAARKLGVPPEGCLVFEDSKLGVAAAEAAGMRWVWVPTQEADPFAK